jgi:hypothetical protein
MARGAFDEASFLWQSVVFYGKGQYIVHFYAISEYHNLFYGNSLKFSISHVPTAIFMRTLCCNALVAGALKVQSPDL